jgi:hypothetical protein
MVHRSAEKEPLAEVAAEIPDGVPLDGRFDAFGDDANPRVRPSRTMVSATATEVALGRDPTNERSILNSSMGRFWMLLSEEYPVPKWSMEMPMPSSRRLCRVWPAWWGSSSSVDSVMSNLTKLAACAVRVLVIGSLPRSFRPPMTL